jgi:hypothetical protein
MRLKAGLGLVKRGKIGGKAHMKKQSASVLRLSHKPLRVSSLF